MDGEGRWDLRAQLLRVLSRVAAHVERQRRRGRSAATDALVGFAIEEGEAEGLIAELAHAFAPQAPQAPQARPGSEAPALRDTDGTEGPLAHAAVAFELAPVELDAVILALAAELDGRFARLIAFVNDHVGRTRPTVGLALAIGHAAVTAVDLLDRPFIRDGLVELEGDGPISGLGLRIPRDLLARLAGAADPSAEITGGVTVRPHGDVRLEHLVLAPSERARLEGWAAALGSERTVPPLLVVGPPGSGRGTAVRAAMGEAHLPAVEVTLGAGAPLAERFRSARREARWHAAGVLVRVSETAADLDPAALWSELARCTAPIALVAPVSAVHAIATAARAEPLVVELGLPDLAARALLWRRFCAGQPLAEADLDDLAARFEFTPRSISRAVRRARAERELSTNGRTLTAADLMLACRELGSAGIGPIAQRVPLPYTRSDLVLPKHLHAELDLAIAWMRHRRQVFDTWGFARRVALGRGLSALFAGPPGTGKTMAAQVLAHDLQLDLYRVDLSRVMSKYIGETEKNLSRLFDEARASGAVLFFDEADALFGKRSEVRDAHDRYANVEIGYLLQRMEEHEGAAILATNRMGDLDEAFRRRLHFILEFPMPSRGDRLRIWDGMFPREAERAPDLSLTRLADAVELSGGEIRNCVLAAAYMAAGEGRPVGLGHVQRALRRELQKNGRVVPNVAALL